MYVIEYKDLHELLELIPKPKKRIKNIDVNYVHSDYDVFIIYDEKNSFVGAYTQDLLFAKTIRQLLHNSEKYQNIFTQSIRCVIIKYKDYDKSISLKNLVGRYSIKI